MDLRPNGRLTYVHLDIVHFYGVESSIWTDPKVRIRIVQMDKKKIVNLDKCPFRQSKITLVGSNFVLSKSTVVERNFGPSKVTVVDRNFWTVQNNCWGPSFWTVQNYGWGP